MLHALFDTGDQQKNGDSVEIILGIPIGIFCSLYAWYVLHHIISPRLSFSQYISEQVRGESTTYHRIKIENTGKRTIIDLDVHIRLLATGVGPFQKNWYGVDLPITLSKIPVLNPEQNKLIGFNLNDSNLFDPDVWGSHITGKAAANSLLITDLLTCGDDAYLIVYVFGYDELSGSRQLNSSHKYRFSDIERNTFYEIPMVKSDKAPSFEERIIGKVVEQARLTAKRLKGRLS